jgi:adenylosuccinate lyase
MIPRYSRPEMTAIWEPATKFRIWYEIEAHACDAQAALGVIPKANAEAVWKAKDVEFDVARIDEIEAVTKHDVIAFLTHLAEIIGNDEARFVHQGMTSSDVLDTTLNIQLVRAADLLLAGVDRVLEALKTRAMEHKMTVRIGRSPRHPCRTGDHGADLRALLRGDGPQPESPGKGAVGGRHRRDLGRGRDLRQYRPGGRGTCLREAGPAARADLTQVIPRDRHAMFFATLGVIASSIENIAIEIRHMQRTEVLEAEEFFSKGQKGSSAMPHKRNPVLTENLTGLARLVRMAVIPAMENVALWHERDISHSSVERMIGPDATVTLDFALHRLAGVIEKLVIYPDNMIANMNKFRGLVHSQRVLLALTQAGVSREDAYRLVQRNAMKVWEEGKDFREELLHPADAEVTAALCAPKTPAPEVIEEKFDLGYHTKHVDTIFARVFGEAGQGANALAQHRRGPVVITPASTDTAAPPAKTYIMRPSGSLSIGGQRLRQLQPQARGQREPVAARRRAISSSVPARRCARGPARGPWARDMGLAERRGHRDTARLRHRLRQRLRGHAAQMRDHPGPRLCDAILRLARFRRVDHVELDRPRQVLGQLHAVQRREVRQVRRIAHERRGVVEMPVRRAGHGEPRAAAAPRPVR